MITPNLYFNPPILLSLSRTSQRKVQSTPSAAHSQCSALSVQGALDGASSQCQGPKSLMTCLPCTILEVTLGDRIPVKSLEETFHSRCVLNLVLLESPGARHVLKLTIFQISAMWSLYHVSHDYIARVHGHVFKSTNAYTVKSPLCK